ncbi:hypothetical protein GGS26DRAFT_98990 [Hypomontagnella submonticulosa]|nr:hypothetical protein GGS26DRAFT_98990 [Hypomontagnella submonticulosa]
MPTITLEIQNGSVFEVLYSTSVINQKLPTLSRSYCVPYQRYGIISQTRCGSELLLVNSNAGLINIRTYEFWTYCPYRQVGYVGCCFKFSTSLLYPFYSSSICRIYGTLLFNLPRFFTVNNEDYIVRQLLRSRTFRQGVDRIHRTVHDYKHGRDPSEPLREGEATRDPKGTRLSAFVSHFLEEIRNDIRGKR